MASKTLGNVDPTSEERAKMIAVLEGLRKRLNKRGSDFAAPRFNEPDGTVELRWASGGREWVVAWISNGVGRQLLVWRHPTYREDRDDAYLHEARK